MSVESVLARVAALEHALADPAALLAASTGGTAAPQAAEPPTSGGGSFAQALQSASAGQALLSGSPAGSATDAVEPGALPLSTPGLTGAPTPVGAPGPTTGTPASGAGAQIVRVAEGQLGQTEQPPGSNESPTIAAYRTAAAGAIPGAPWCAYFASWVARQAGEPLGAAGEGLGSVAQIWSWAQSAGRAIPNGPGVVPRPGDLIVFGDAHVGIVRGVLPNGDIQTIEGNYENRVAANVRTPTAATGYVSLS